MDFLKNQGQKIREQLSGLTPSQKMLAGSLVVIMVMTLMWWSRYAGTSEMVAVLEQDFSDENISRVGMLLKSHEIPYKVVGKRVQVPAERQVEAIAVLGFEQLLPSDMSSGFDQIIERMDSPWNTDRKQEVVFNRAKEVTLAQVIRAFPDVRNATVVIDNTQRRSFGEANREPTATVHIQTRNRDKAPKKLVEAAADVVAGAVSGMKRGSVNVIVDGASHKVRDKGEDGIDGGADRWMEIIQWAERYYTDKVEDHLGRMIPGVFVNVTVDPNLTSRQMERQEYDKAKTFDRPTESTERTEENQTNSRGLVEPGAVPNVGANVGVGGANQAMSVGGAGAGGDATINNVTENKTKNQVFPTMIREWIKSPAGSAAVVGASVSVPRSHFVRVFKMAYPQAKDPDDEALQPIIDKEMPSIRGVALGALPIGPDKVKLNVYYDYLPAGLADAAAQPAAATNFPLAAIRSYGKEIALGFLAVMSLFMVSMMVRKGSPAVVVPPPVEKAAPGPIPNAEDIAGEAMQGDQSMEAVEIDDAAVKTQQMIGQVQNMVRENPDAAANLVKRWLNRA